jgi:hypothetical protein
VIKIAVIGSHDFLEQIWAVAPQISDIEIDPYIYTNPKDAADLVREMKPCDVLFFSGELPYYFSKKSREKLSIPSLYLATDEMSITSSFLSILYKKQVPPERLSVDIIDFSVVSNVFNEMELDLEPSQILEYRPMVENQFDLKKIVDFHLHLWNKKKIDLALTSIHAVHDRLQSLGVPAIRIRDPKISLIKGLQNAKNRARLYKSEASQVAVGYVLADISQGRVRALAHEIHASFQQLNEQLFIFYTTRGDIEALIENTFLHDLIESHPSFLFGFGYGATITEAERNAKTALRFSTEEGVGKCGHILTEEKELLGPFPNEVRQYRLKNDDIQLFEVAKQTKLSPANLTKIIEFSKSRQYLHFTSADLAEYLQLTRRSAERMIKKLHDHGYIKVVGEEMIYKQGRPRAIYQLNMPIYQ